MTPNPRSMFLLALAGLERPFMRVDPMIPYSLRLAIFKLRRQQNAKTLSQTDYIAMSWYYELNNEQQGPVSEEALREMINACELPSRSRVWTQGMSDWEDFEKVVYIGHFFKET